MSPMAMIRWGVTISPAEQRSRGETNFVPASPARE
jgi:hypothetical protein